MTRRTWPRHHAESRQGSAPGNPDEEFVLAAARAVALGLECPRVPQGGTWIDLAVRAGVLRLLEALINDEPDQVSSAASTRSRLSGAATGLRALTEIRRISSAFDAGGVRWVVLKGPVLGEVVYTRPSVRGYNDLDLMVHPQDLEAALESLQAVGFRRIDQNWKMIADMKRGELSLLGCTGMLIDLHWTPINEARARSQFRFDVASMIERRCSFLVDGVTLPSLSPDDLIIHLAIHAALSGGHRLLWLLDLQQALQWAGWPTESLMSRSEHHAASLPLAVMLGRVGDYLDPRAQLLARSLKPRSPWSRYCAHTSRACLPLGTRSPAHTGRAVFAATRRSSTTSMVELVRSLVHDQVQERRHADDPHRLEVLHAKGGAEADRRHWLDMAAASVRAAPGS